jgi:hypothetical protein
MKKKLFMKKHLIDVTPTAAEISAANAHLDGIFQSIGASLRILADGERNRVQHLGRRNETFALAAIEVARQNPQVVPPGIDMAALERDITARAHFLPMLMRFRQMTRMMEDTVAMLGVDIYGGGRGVYRSLQLVGDIFGLADTVEELGQHFAKTPTEKDESPSAGDAAETSK